MTASAENQSGKRKHYTIGALLISIVILMTLVILSYSKYILSEQQRTTEKGQRLAERYVYAQVFAERLHDGTEAFLVAKTEAERIRAVKEIAEARLTGAEALGLFIEADSLTSGLSREEASKPILEAINAVVGAESPLATIGERDGPLTDEEVGFLTNVRDGASGIQQSLEGFRAPTGEAGFRQMASMAEWKPHAFEASKRLKELAEAIRK